MSKEHTRDSISTCGGAALRFFLFPFPFFLGIKLDALAAADLWKWAIALPLWNTLPDHRQNNACLRVDWAISKRILNTFAKNGFDVALLQQGSNKHKQTRPL